MQQKRETLGQIMRFGVVGAVSTAIHLSIYWLLQHFINVNIAYSAGYFLSLARNGAGFAGAHIFNYFLQIGLFNFFLWIGLHRLLAPFAVLMIAVPTNFVIVRFVFKHFSKKS